METKLNSGEKMRNATYWISFSEIIYHLDLGYSDYCLVLRGGVGLKYF